MFEQPHSDGPRIAKTVGAGGVGCALLVLGAFFFGLVLFIFFWDFIRAR